MLRFIAERYAVTLHAVCYKRRVNSDSKDIEMSLRADIAGLIVPIEESEHASGYNAALREVLSIIERHEHERQKRSARAIAKRKIEGKKIGGDLPYGRQLSPDGETLCDSPGEQRVISAARKLRSEGHSLREVARLLTVRRMRPREGNKFHAAQIKRITDEEK